MAHWLVKSEPVKYSWGDLVRDGKTNWDGVRNNQAALHLKAMTKGDLCFFYHSGDERQIVGLVEVTKAAYPKLVDYLHQSQPGRKFIVVGEKSYPVDSIAAPHADIAVQSAAGIPAGRR